jgi:hypothetical protein
MQIILFILATLFSVSSFATSEEQMKAKILELERWQNRISKSCLNNPQSDQVYFMVQGKKVKCAEMIVAANKFRLEVDREVAEFKRTCSAENGKDQKDQLARQAANIANRSVACQPAADSKNCFGPFMCSAAAAMPGASAAMWIGGMVSRNESLRTCGTQGNNCLTSALRGVFDSVWSSLTLLWDVGKWGVRKIGEWTGIIRNSEVRTSHAAMAAQQKPPGAKKRSISEIAHDLYASLEASALDHYGCEKWSGLPFGSSCLRKMSTWNCSSCGQKAQVMCGIVGYAAGEIVTAFLTGGLFSAGKTVGKGALEVAMKVGAGPSRNIASLMARTFPKASEAVAEAAGAVVKLTARGLTRTQEVVINSWERVKNAQVTRAVMAAAATKTGVIVTLPIRGIGLYIHAMDKAFLEGGAIVDRTVARVAGTVVRPEIARGAKIADEAVGASPQDAIAPNGIVVTDVPAEARAGAAVADSASEAGKDSGTVARSTPPEASPPTAARTKEKPSPAATANRSPAEAEADQLIRENNNSAALIVKYSEEPEYSSLFKAESKYPEEKRDIAIVISDMEKRNPARPKAEIKNEVDQLLNTCGI